MPQRKLACTVSTARIRSSWHTSFDEVEMGSFAVIIELQMTDMNRKKGSRNVIITGLKCRPWITTSLELNQEWIRPYNHMPSATDNINVCILIQVIADTQWVHVSPQTTNSNGRLMDHITVRAMPQCHMISNTITGYTTCSTAKPSHTQTTYNQ